MFRRRENHKLPLWVAIAIVLQCVIAERADADTSLITLNTRTFDMQADVSEMRRNDSFIPLQDIVWLRELLDRDEYLHGTVVQFKAKSRPVLDGWPPNEYYERFTRLDGIPEEFMVDGLLARSAHESNMDILYTPLENPGDFFVSCSKVDKGTDVFGFCAVRASYPPDSNIMLLARVYHPGTRPFHFREIAYRLREIAYCLDVTNTSSDESVVPRPRIGPLDEIPELTNCIALIS